MLLKVTGKVSLNCNTQYSSIHSIHDYCYYSLFLLLFTVYTIIVTVTVTVTVSSQYSSNTDIDCLTELNNNVNGQLALGLGKLMEEIAFVFWVDLGYRLRSRLRVPLQGSRGMTGIPYVLLLFHCSYSEITVTVTKYLAVRPGSAPGN